jgi:hypothetical protein
MSEAKVKKVKAPTDSDNFKKRVAGVIKSGKSIRANIQDLMHYAILQYLDPANSGNSADLSFLQAQVTGVKSLNHKLMGEYIEDTVNLKLGKTAEGAPVFKKAVKGDAPSLTDTADLTANWWEHGRVTEPKLVDLLKVIDTAIKSVSSTINNDADKRKGLVEGQMCAVQQTLKGLEDQRTATLKLINDAAAESAAVEAEFCGPVALVA